MERLQLAFGQVATGFGLSISKPEVIGNTIIGFDSVTGKLLFVDLNADKPRNHLIDLKEVKDCSVVKTYFPISGNSNIAGEIVQTVGLQFDYKNNKKMSLLPFYILTIDQQSEVKARTKKAREWQTRLSRSSIDNGYSVEKYNAKLPVYGETIVLTY